MYLKVNVILNIKTNLINNNTGLSFGINAIDKKIKFVKLFVKMIQF